MSQALKDKDNVRIIDACSGIGVVGYASSKILLENECKVKLTLIDVRRDVL